jgi:hypothetical protein
MSIIFNWSISKMQVIPVQGSKTNIVTRVEWLVKAIDKDNNASTSTFGICNFSLGDTFIPFEELTEQQVLNWCFAFKNFKTDIETQVSEQIVEQIARQLNQKQTEPALPWLKIPA